MDKKKRILLIDDFQNCEFNQATSKLIVNEAISKFGKLIIAIDSANSVLPTMRTEFQDIEFYSIKTLGYKKRNELVERYVCLKENLFTFNDQNLLNLTNRLFDDVQAVLGDKLMPAYPIYILAILQAFEYKPLKQNETSFAYCYQTLIHYSLYQAGVSNENIDTYFNFLTELAYDFVINEREEITIDDFLTFYVEYRTRFIVPTYEIIHNLIKKSKIVHFNDSTVTFGYNYVLYYLSAKKISDVIHTKQGIKTINKLFAGMHIEKNANILVFIMHHSRDISFIEQSLLSSMMVLENTNPITLEKNDPYYEAIKEIADELKKDILEINRNPREERNRQLSLRDEKERYQEIERADYENELNEATSITLPFKQSFRSIEIVGQIIKNRKGSLEISQITDMIKEVYTTGFRTIGYVGELLNSAKNEITEAINEGINEEDSRKEIDEKINRFIQMIGYHVCLAVFGKLTHSVGHKDLRTIYSNVAKLIDTPAAKLVTLSINSYYGSISVDEVKSLATEFKNNPIALKILKSKVKFYVYNKNPDYKTKQRFASSLGMTIGPINPNPR